MAEGKAAKLNQAVSEAVATLQDKDKEIKKLQVTTRMKTVKLKKDILDNVELIQNMFQVRAGAVLCHCAARGGGCGGGDGASHSRVRVCGDRRRSDRT